MDLNEPDSSVKKPKRQRPRLPYGEPDQYNDQDLQMRNEEVEQSSKDRSIKEKLSQRAKRARRDSVNGLD